MLIQQQMKIDQIYNHHCHHPTTNKRKRWSEQEHKENKTFYCLKEQSHYKWNKNAATSKYDTKQFSFLIKNTKTDHQHEILNTEFS